ncbi:sulfurtransferase [endosymbiont of Lamellibrachia barhami]|uniref:sulfurtransferase n=1 Tax=endosymbiont of Lamellibrachia barhami TaxID=205975 RepID=UPI001FE522E6|nr:rhodanese-like domain-containing protein [endosymbiont of Lamellibrachia barhami]
MMKPFALSLLLIFTTTFALAAQPLVSPEWVHNNRGKSGVVILDLQDAKAYQRYHVPGAVNSSYGDWRRTSAKKIPQIMTPPAQLEKLIGRLGIDNDTHVVLVTTGNGAGDMASASRVYWTFKALGHDQVSILGGGLINYAQKRVYPLQNGLNQAVPKVFKVNLRADYIPDAQEVKAALEKGALAVDNRSRAEYMGIYSGSGKERPGSLPKAVNISYDWLTANGGATFHTIDNLKKIYAANQVPLSGPQINYCHTGHRAALGWFVSHELLGNKQARLYDGSTAEWALDHALPMEQKVQLKH